MGPKADKELSTHAFLLRQLVTVSVIRVAVIERERQASGF
eukprot:COSAG06_NODE_267_length_18822_cov_26.254607_16_plen_40_part_00